MAARSSMIHSLTDPFTGIMLIDNMDKAHDGFVRTMMGGVGISGDSVHYFVPTRARNALSLIERPQGQDSEPVALHLPRAHRLLPHPRRIQNLEMLLEEGVKTGKGDER
jgi:hypothetical protein